GHCTATAASMRRSGPSSFRSGTCCGCSLPCWWIITREQPDGSEWCAENRHRYGGGHCPGSGGDGQQGAAAGAAERGAAHRGGGLPVRCAATGTGCPPYLRQGRRLGPDGSRGAMEPAVLRLYLLP